MQFTNITPDELRKAADVIYFVIMTMKAAQILKSWLLKWEPDQDQDYDDCLDE